MVRQRGHAWAGAAGQTTAGGRGVCTGFRGAPVWLQAGDKEGAKDADRQALLVRLVFRAGVSAQA